MSRLPGVGIRSPTRVDARNPALLVRPMRPADALHLQPPACPPAERRAGRPPRQGVLGARPDPGQGVTMSATPDAPAPPAPPQPYPAPYPAPPAPPPPDEPDLPLPPPPPPPPPRRGPGPPARQGP